MKLRTNSKNERAIALIIVLAMLVLLAGLIVSFMTAVGNERAASTISNSELTSRQIADSTVNLVISQIREATSQNSSNQTPTTWASQPGAIRTFSGAVSGVKPIQNAGAGGVRMPTYRAGNNDYIFKLYSAEKMKVEASSFGNNPWDRDETGVINRWDWSRSEKEREEKDSLFGYVDMNEPIVTPMPVSLTNGDRSIVEPRYPIIDPRAKYDSNENENKTPDPGIVEGFDLKTGLTNKALKFIPKDVDGKRKAGTSNVPYLPMPVKWLYVMRDGSMAAAEDSNGGRILGASKDNPIVGRTAFWTDDDAARLNINTASEGTYWETPTASSEQESGQIDNSGTLLSAVTGALNLSAAQPARGEYQRYPGHPATTCLSPALGWMWGILPTEFPRQYRDTKLVAMKDAIAQMSPFMAYGKKGSISATEPPQSTSMGGSYNALRDSGIPLDPAIKKPKEKEPRLGIGTKHLYSTVDELIFKQERPQTVTINGADVTVLNSDKLRPESLEKVRFFLTANSRSPELNLFGRPRVTFWPINDDPAQRTAFDDLFAFTSTFYKDVNGTRDNSFFFTRSNAKSPTIDYNANNQKMMTYLKTLTSAKFPIPGFGGSFADKYSVEERDQILTLIFDYCRCVNLVDTSTRIRVGALFKPYTPFYYDPDLDAKAYNTYAPRSVDWSGQVTPLRVEGNSLNQGLGRAPMISEAVVAIHRVGGGGKQIQATLFFEMATVMPGYPVIRDTYWMRVTPLRATTIGTTDIQLVGAVDQARFNIVNVGNHDVGYGRGYLPGLGFINQMHYFPEPTKPTPDGATSFLTGQATPKKFEKHPSTLDGGYIRKTSSQYYPFVSTPIDAPAELSVSLGKFKVELIAGEAPDDTDTATTRGRGNVFQTYIIDFPQDTFKVPTPAGTADRSFGTRLTGTEGTWTPTIDANDVIRSVEFVGAKLNPDGSGQPLVDDQRGDLRLGAALQIVPSAAFQPRGGIEAYKLAANKAVHGLQSGHGEPFTGYYSTGGRGTLAAGGKNNEYPKWPILPVGVKGVKRSDGGPGDWDRGLSKHVDGAFGNKVDEGNVFFNIGDSGGGRVPYFRGRAIEETGKSFFSPNRQLSSAVMFGSLPTGSRRGLPWQTLLFRPDRGAISHPGAQQVGKPADHLLLDLFNLPVVEPFAISEPFSTGGKVNLNYVIAPFGYAQGDPGTKRKGATMDRSYLRRDTALRGVLKSVQLMAVATGQNNAGHEDNPYSVNQAYRFDIDAERTLDQFESRFKDPDRGLFRSASEICDMDLYPIESGKSPGVNGTNPTSPAPSALLPALTDWGKFWDTDYAQTGDNMRERPYSHIYPRVTTKSNVYTVFIRAQAVKKVGNSDPTKFDPTKDKVIGAYRGSATIERYIDPNDKELENYDPNAQNSSVDKFYRFRVLATKQFLPR